jgi:hypothetical protein
MKIKFIFCQHQQKSTEQKKCSNLNSLVIQNFLKDVGWLVGVGDDVN